MTIESIVNISGSYLNTFYDFSTADYYLRDNFLKTEMHFLKPESLKLLNCI